MSFAEDFINSNAMYLIINDTPAINHHWENGYHVTQHGKKIDLDKMTTEHLTNTIQYFRGELDVSSLEAELARRK